MRILIACATGLVGSELVKASLNSNHIEEIYILQRKLSDWNDPKIKVLVADFDHYHPEIIPDKLDAVFCCLGTTLKNAGSKSGFRKVDYCYVTSVRLKTSSITQNYPKFQTINTFIEKILWFSTPRPKPAKIPQVPLYRQSST